MDLEDAEAVAEAGGGIGHRLVEGDGDAGLDMEVQRVGADAFQVVDVDARDAVDARDDVVDAALDVARGAARDAD